MYLSLAVSDPPDVGAFDVLSEKEDDVRVSARKLRDFVVCF